MSSNNVAYVLHAAFSYFSLFGHCFQEENHLLYFKDSFCSNQFKGEQEDIVVYQQSCFLTDMSVTVLVSKKFFCWLFFLFNKKYHFLLSSCAYLDWHLTLAPYHISETFSICKKIIVHKEVANVVVM